MKAFFWKYYLVLKNIQKYFNNWLYNQMQQILIPNKPNCQQAQSKHYFCRYINE